MKMSTKGRYAVMAMIDIAQDTSGGPVSLAAIAERQDISQEYLEQLFAKLRRAGLVESCAGPGRRLSPVAHGRSHQHGGDHSAPPTSPCASPAAMATRLTAASAASAAVRTTCGRRSAGR